jgi:hypothetical protein
MLDAFARQMLYPAPPVAVPSPPPSPLEEVWLDLATGERAMAWTSIHAMTPGAPVTLFFHGNGENLETMRRAGMCEELESLGTVFLVIDYPGYGRSSGSPSEEGLLATGEAAVAWARERHPDRPVIVCGWSLGAAVAIATAARHPEEVRGLIALSPWTNLADVAHGIFPAALVRAMLREHYDSLAAAATIRAPALVIHGERDNIIPVDHGQRIAEALAGPTRWVPVRGAAHNDLLSREEVWQEMSRFYSEITSSKAF